MRTSIRVAVVLLLGILGICAAGYGDGAYFPPVVVEDMPKIPAQQALIIWENQTEQLVIQSEVDGAGKSLAWVVPVPAEPTRLEAASPGVLTTLKFGVRPDTMTSFSPALFFGIIGLIWCLFLLSLNRFAPGRSLVFTLLVLLGPALILPTLSRARESGGGERPAFLDGDVEVLHAEPVGNYDVEVLKAKNAEALRGWLKQNGFRDLPPRGQEIAGQYISEGWVFVIAKLRREREGYARPHPLSIAFPAKKPVYPMRLTQLANSDLRLELYVIAQDRVDAPGMETIFCDSYGRTQNESGKDLSRGDYTRLSLGLPWLVERMGTQCVVTQLRANLKPQSMDRDIELSSVPFSPKRLTVYLPRTIYQVMVGRGLLAFDLCLGLGLLIHYLCLQEGRPSRGWYKAALLGCCLALVVAAWPWFTYNRATEMPRYPEGNRGPSVGETTMALIMLYPELLKTMNRQDIESYFREALANSAARYTGEPIQPGQGPGQYEILEDQRGIFVRYYYGPGSWKSIGLPSDVTLLDADGKPVDDDLLEADRWTR